MVMCQITE